MPITTEFEYVRPATMDEALRLLYRYKGSARVLAGGTDLIVQLKEGVSKPEVVVDIKKLRGLDAIEMRSGSLRIGALATFSDIMDSPVVKKHCPLLREAAMTVASTGVRNRATLAGNICSAVPSADAAPVLAVYDSDIIVKGPQGVRNISIHEWFLGPRRTALAPDEIVLAVELKVPSVKTGGCYAKLSRYEGEDLAQGGLAVLTLSGRSYRVAVCALGPRPARCPKTEAVLNGASKLNEKTLARAKAALTGEIAPITDIRSTREYRLHMAGVMLGRALNAATARLLGRPPRYGEKVI
ncbi:MAG TPA: xanthine dehydrogenase family protein subunit M [Elusimicrobiales bacterium]|nr:xanthine dehydrogenase family protein subunit M [Elusimicrobiales bacterium]